VRTRANYATANDIRDGGLGVLKDLAQESSRLSATLKDSEVVVVVVVVVVAGHGASAGGAAVLEPPPTFHFNLLHTLCAVSRQKTTDFSFAISFIPRYKFTRQSSMYKLSICH